MTTRTKKTDAELVEAISARPARLYLDHERDWIWLMIDLVEVRGHKLTSSEARRLAKLVKR